MEWCNWVLAGIAAIFFILDLYLTKKLKDTVHQLETLKEEVRISELRIEELKYHILELGGRVWELQSERDNLETEIKTRRESINETFETQLAHLQEKTTWEHNELVRTLQKEYQTILDDLVETAHQRTDETQVILDRLRSQIDELKSKHDAAVEDYKRAQEMKDKQNFYKLQLSDLDIQEIQKLREVEPYLRDTRPLNKVIWSVYYEHPCTDLIGRVIGSGRHTGIYKLTNITNGMTYVGQAVDIANRWKQHIRCAIGAENTPNNKLYPAMREVGPEQFTFEIIEECAPEALNEREQYWQEFYKAKEFGYSVR